MRQAPLPPSWGTPVAGSWVEALSLWEPWASLMMVGPKTIETRSWRTDYRGPLLICAALRRDAESLDLLGARSFQRALAPMRRPGKALVTMGDLHYGHAVALVDLVDCRMTGAYTPPSFYASQEDFGDYTPGRWAWVTRNLRVFPPFEVRGAQGLFRVQLPAGFSAVPR